LLAAVERGYLETLRVLVGAIEAKDPYTAGHSQRTAELAVAIARAMGLDQMSCTEIEFGGLLHDIGKIGVPLTILNKPGPLTDEEWDVMRMHPEWGARIIEPVPALAGARELVIACHEHFDGTGYPLGLAGEEIPLGARIILTCDAYHAMTSDRVYRKAMGRDKALAEIRRCAGSQFDPRVAEALVEAVTSISE
jgi:HD-GYP domain-containing protein (c-di-GMP phosphodiesterase class II)